MGVTLRWASGLWVVVLSLSALSGPVLASRSATASALAEAGASDLSGRGTDSPFGNPATLAWDPQLVVRIGSGAALLQNDTYTWHDYGRWNGERWSEEDKREILGRIGKDGAEGRFEASLLTPAVAGAGWALGARRMERGQIHIPREYADLVLFGNRVGQSIDFPRSSGKSMAYFDVTLSHGRRLTAWRGWEVSAGGTAHWLHGLRYDELRNAAGSLVTTPDAIDGELVAESRTAEGGTGYSIDVALALRTSPQAVRTSPGEAVSAAESRDLSGGRTLPHPPPHPDGLHGPYEFGLTLRSAVGALRWSDGTRLHVDRARADSLTLEDADEDDPIETASRSTNIDPFSQRLPSELTLSGALWLSRVRFELDWSQGFGEDAGTTRTPRVALGSSYWRWAAVTPKAGLCVGGIDGPVLALGARIRFWHCDLDIAYQSVGGLDISLPKGVALGLAITVRTLHGRER